MLYIATYSLLLDEIPFLTRYCHFILNSAKNEIYGTNFGFNFSEHIIFGDFSCTKVTFYCNNYLPWYSKCAFLKPIALKLQIFCLAPYFKVDFWRLFSREFNGDKNKLLINRRLLIAG